jgi:hypothetical protein
MSILSPSQRQVGAIPDRTGVQAIVQISVRFSWETEPSRHSKTIPLAATAAGFLSGRLLRVGHPYFTCSEPSLANPLLYCEPRVLRASLCEAPSPAAWERTTAETIQTTVFR